MPTGRRRTAEELHELRQRVVEHRYQMEIVQALWPRMVKLWVGEAQRLRERLGSHQDLVVLARHDRAARAAGALAFPPRAR